MIFVYSSIDTILSSAVADLNSLPRAKGMNGNILCSYPNRFWAPKISFLGQIERIVTIYFVILTLQCISGSHTQKERGA